MSGERDWQALRRPLRRCAIPVLGLLAFLVFWQVAIPGDGAATPIWLWPMILALAVCIPTAPNLALSACLRLWRVGRRGMAFVPIGVLLAVGIGLPAVAVVAGVSPWLAFVAWLLSLAGSSVLSALLIISTPAVVSPAPAPLTDFSADEPHAYARDIAEKRKSG